MAPYLPVLVTHIWQQVFPQKQSQSSSDGGSISTGAYGELEQRSSHKFCIQRNYDDLKYRQRNTALKKKPAILVRF